MAHNCPVCGNECDCDGVEPTEEIPDTPAPDDCDHCDDDDEEEPMHVRFTESVTTYTFAIGEGSQLLWAWPWATSNGYPFRVRVGAWVRGRRRR